MSDTLEHVRRLHAATVQIAERHDLALTAERVAAVRAYRSGAGSLTVLGEILGVTKQRMSQIVQAQEAQ